MGVATGMLIAAGVSAAAGAYSAHKQSSAAKKAAETQAGAANQATSLQRDIYNQGRQDTLPWLQTGQGAITTLGNLMGIAPYQQQMTYPGQQQAGMVGMPGQPPSRTPSDAAQYTGTTAVPRNPIYSGQPQPGSQPGAPGGGSMMPIGGANGTGMSGMPGGTSGGLPPGAQTFMNPNAPQLQPDGSYSTPSNPGQLAQIGPDGQPMPVNQSSQGGNYPLASVSGTGLMRAWDTPFIAPDPNSIQNDPSYQWRFNEGQRGVQSSAAAKGNLLTGGTLKDLTAWSQGAASQEYDKIYNRGLGEYRQAYDIYNQNQANQFNRLSSLAGVGQQANQSNLSAGMNFGAQAGQNMMGAANAQAAGQIGSAGAWGGFANQLGNIGQQVAYGWDASRTRTPPLVNQSPYQGQNMPLMQAPTLR